MNQRTNKPCIFKNTHDGQWNVKWIGGKTNPEFLTRAIAWVLKQNRLMAEQIPQNKKAV